MGNRITLVFTFLVIFVCTTIITQLVVIYCKIYGSDLILLLITISSTLYKCSFYVSFFNIKKNRTKFYNFCQKIKILSEYSIAILTNLLDIFDLMKILDSKIDQYWYKN
jgi:hypothetical protein